MTRTWTARTVEFNGKTMSLNAFANAVGLSFYKAGKYLAQGMTTEQLAASLRATIPATVLAQEIGIPVARIRKLRKDGATQAEIEAEALV